MEELFQTDRTSILRHIKNIYKTGELEEKSTCAKISQVREEGNRNVRREILYYNLDVIISVGYRVNSHRGTQFRIWATQQLKEYLIKGFVLDDERLKSLTTWKGEKIRKSDVTIAKSYLSEDELKQLNLLVEQYLAFAEAQAQAKKPMYMKDWIKKLNDILTINEREILEHAGKVRKKIADEIAAEEYEKYRKKKIG